MDQHDVPQPAGGGANERGSVRRLLRSSSRSGRIAPCRLYVLALELLLRRHRNGTANPALRGVLFAGCVRARVSTYADDITVFVSHRSDIKAVKKVVKRYEVAGAKINFDKSEGLRLGAWRCGVTLLGLFRWSDGAVCILEVWFGPGLPIGWRYGPKYKRTWVL